ncbi:carbohydrate binding domain-containing protein [Staphylococcus virus vB_SurM-PSU5]|nr:carbohydrate binding domain-containing protein [Staphylococcus virus vB_SurM-PSU5]
MAFEYTPLTKEQKIKDMYPKVNDIGNFLKKEIAQDNIKTLYDVDLYNLNIPSGSYYIVRAVNSPYDTLPNNGGTTTRNGYLIVNKKDSSYQQITFTPYNNGTAFILNYTGNTKTEWKKVKLDEGSLYDEGNTLNVKELTESTTQYATLINPPKENLNTGWVDYKESKNGISSLVEFNPINSTSTFKMIRKLPVQEQNPNLLRDSLFVYPETSSTNIKTDNWSTPPFWGYTANSGRSGVRFKGENAIQIDDGGSTYPTAMTNRFKMGNELSVGDTVTVSVYAKINDPTLLKDNLVYFELAGYDVVDREINPYTGGRREITASEITTEWKKYSFTFTIPTNTIGASGVKINYISLLLRMNCTSSRGNGAVVYYALPKLEKASKVTPFITHVNDVRKYDEIWSNWQEVISKDELKTHSTVDIEYNDYFKYVWFKNEVNEKNIKDLAMTVPQGYHTFYCQGSIEGTPRGRSIRGTIQVDYDKGDPYKANKFVKLMFTDSEGIPYTLYYGGYNQGWKPLKQQRTSTILWEGTLDYGSKENITLNDPWTHYDMLEVVYSTQSSGHYKTMFLDLRTPTTPYLYIRDFNLSNSSTGSGVDFFEGYLSFPTTTSAIPSMVKKVTLNGSTNTTSVADFNTQGIITIYRIAGINTL